MDKAILTRQFWMPFEIFLGKFQEEIGKRNNINSYGGNDHELTYKFIHPPWGMHLISGKSNVSIC
jgi:hypothetical protein